MPSLRETLNGHLREKHEIIFIAPEYDLFSDDLSPIPGVRGSKYGIEIAKCSWLLPLKRFRRHIRKMRESNSLPSPFRWLINMSILFFLTVTFLLKAFKVCKKDAFKPDLIYAHNQYSALAGFLLGKLWKVPNVTRLYGTFLADLMAKPFVSLRYPTAAAGYLVPSSLLICTNDGTRGDEVARKFRISQKRFRFWQNGVEPPSSPPKMTREDFLTRNPKLNINSKWIVSCSRLSYWKRIDRMLNALVVCKKEGVDCQLIIAGDGPEKENLQNIAKKSHIEDSIVWLGAVDHDDIWGLLNVSDVFTITNDVTNRCNPLYEAAWATLPVVSVKDPSTSDLLIHGENALLADKENPTALGQYLCQICRNEKMKEKMKDSQKRLSASFWTWEERMKAEVKELEKVIRPLGR
ncbi:glycosyltransferase family 4 protein [Desulfobacter latus]|nr:glycosyltransferase family 4 protein [Desulfobacter latus]